MNWFSRYSLTYEFFIICIIAILTHFDNNFTNIFRVKNDFYRIAFCQSCTPFLLFICTLDSKAKHYYKHYYILLYLEVFYHSSFFYIKHLLNYRDIFLLAKAFTSYLKVGGFSYNLFLFHIDFHKNIHK